MTSSKFYSRSFITVFMSSFLFFYIRGAGEAPVGPVMVHCCSFLLLLSARLKGGGEMKYSEGAVSALCAPISCGRGGVEGDGFWNDLTANLAGHGALESAADPYLRLPIRCLTGCWLFF